MAQALATKDLETVVDKLKEKIDSKVSKVRDRQRLRARLKIIVERKEQEFKAIQAKHSQDKIKQMAHR